MTLYWGPWPPERTPGIWNHRRELVRFNTLGFAPGLLARLDGGLCTGSTWDEAKKAVTRPPLAAQIEGRVRFFYMGARFTFFAWWDRSVDSRPGSNVAFLTSTVLPARDAIKLARFLFPVVFARMRYPLYDESGLVRLDVDAGEAGAP